LTSRRFFFELLTLNSTFLGGHLKPDVYYQISSLADKYGIQAAEEVAAFEIAHIAAVQSCVEKEGIDCDLELNEVIDVQFDDNHCAKTKAGYESLISQGVQTAKEAEFSPEETAEAVSTTRVVPKMLLLFIIYVGVWCESCPGLLQGSHRPTLAI
jgi:hypothetical protein